jgi:hypothetical protein
MPALTSQFNCGAPQFGVRNEIAGGFQSFAGVTAWFKKISGGFLIN